jgi:hypothetical protein
VCLNLEGGLVPLDGSVIRESADHNMPVAALPYD